MAAMLASQTGNPVGVAFCPVYLFGCWVRKIEILLLGVTKDKHRFLHYVIFFCFLCCYYYYYYYYYCFLYPFFFTLHNYVHSATSRLSFVNLGLTCSQLGCNYCCLKEIDGVHLLRIRKK